MNKYEQLSNWLLGYTQINNWLHFNVVRMESGGFSLQSVPGNTIVQQYNDGSTERELIFAISMVQMYDAEQSTNNLNAIQEVDNFEQWMIKQTAMPDFGENVTINSIEILDHVPNLSVDNENSLCNYLFQCKVVYLEQ